MKKINIAFDRSGYESIENLNPFQGDLKSLSKDAYLALKKEILETGFAFPFHAWTNPEDNLIYIIGGHQRLRTLQKMREEGFEIPNVPVNFIKAKSYKEAKRRVLQDVSQYGQVERQGLYEFVHEADIGIDDLANSFVIPDINLNMDDFKTEFFDDPSKIDPAQEDVVTETPKSTKVKRGDIFILGGHRLKCGDSTSIDDVERLMDGHKAQMCFCDPPYGVSYQNKNKMLNSLQSPKGGLETPIHGDDLSIDELKDLVSAIFKNIYLSLDKKSSYYITAPQGGELGLMMMMMMMQESGIPCRHMIVWVKNNAAFSMNRLDYDYRHEPILYGWSKDKTHEFYSNGTHKNSVWEIDRENNKLHPTMKPIAIIENALLNSTKTGDSVIDLCGGSGSTLIACEKTNRKCFMMEIDPIYCQVIIDRWSNLTGGIAYLLKEDGSKVPFSEI